MIAVGFFWFAEIAASTCYLHCMQITKEKSKKRIFVARGDRFRP